jgi:hypothetical protein
MSEGNESAVKGDGWFQVRAICEGIVTFTEDCGHRKDAESHDCIARQQRSK